MSQRQDGVSQITEWLRRDAWRDAFRAPCDGPRDAWSGSSEPWPIHAAVTQEPASKLFRVGVLTLQTSAVLLAGRQDLSWAIGISGAVWYPEVDDSGSTAHSIVSG